MIETKTLIDACVFAADKHKFQRRKGCLKIPYINHPLKVCKILIDCGESDTDLLVAAVLHDTVEDTDTSFTEIKERYNAHVANLVGEVKDNKTLSYAERKALQIKKAPGLSDNAKKLKIADKICNINDMVTYPINWPDARKHAYIDWSVMVFEGCKGINNMLDRLFSDTIENAKKQLRVTRE